MSNHYLQKALVIIRILIVLVVLNFLFGMIIIFTRNTGILFNFTWDLLISILIHTIYCFFLILLHDIVLMLNQLVLRIDKLGSHNAKNLDIKDSK
jgi:hypothetical protein